MGWLDNWKDDGSIRLDVAATEHDLTVATVLYDGDRERHECYADILVQRVKERARFVWKKIPYRSGVRTTGISGAMIRLTSRPSEAAALGEEGYRLVEAGKTPCGKYPSFDVVGATDRAVLFGLGRLLREMRMDFYQSYGSGLQRVCCVRKGLNVTSKPDYPMRQHQIAYRPKTNAYDAFTVGMMQREVLDLALFGTNAIEMIPPGIDDASQSPNFPVPWLEMIAETSKYCDRLDINVSMWYPAFFKNYSDPDTLKAAKKHWELIFSSYHRLDVLFVPGGDPGGRAAPEFFGVVEMQAEFLRTRFFPKCQVWVSSQYSLSTSIDLGLTERWIPLERESEWIEMLKTERVQKFLDGVVYGPWSSLPIDEFRAQIPKCLPLRNYPDLCHVQTCEMPVSTWDLSFAVTNNREGVNPRPREMARIIESQAPHTIGCGCYSEGVNDDVNKYVWTALHWGADVVGPLAGATTDTQLTAMLRQYACLLVGQSRNADTVVAGIYALEDNWHCPLAGSRAVQRSIEIFSKLESKLQPLDRKNWRLSLLLFKFYFDFFLYTRLNREVELQDRSLSLLTATQRWPGIAHPDNLARAKQVMLKPYLEPPVSLSSFSSPSTKSALDVTGLTKTPTITFLYGKIMSYVSLLYEQIGYQLSIGSGGQHRQRGAFADLSWAPLGDVAFLNRAFGALMKRDGDNDDEVARFASALRRFTCSLREMRQDVAGASSSPKRVLWYASFGDESAHECCGVSGRPTRPIPVSEVLSPHRPLLVGEDPVYFARPLTEYIDLSNDELLRKCHAGLVPRAWRSWFVPIWPRTSKDVSMRFDLGRLRVRPDTRSLTIRVTYVGKDLNRHGGDWEELGRVGMAVRLVANGGVVVHDFMDEPDVTETRDLIVPSTALRNAVESGELVLRWEPKYPRKVTFVKTPLPIAELWLLTEGTQPREISRL